MASKMQIEQKEIPVCDVVAGYKDTAEEGVYGYGGNLNIRPKYQREFIYNEKQRAAVINTILKGFPLNTMYWMVNDDGSYEILDGQQRTVSLCQYYAGDFSVKIDKNSFGFNNLTDAEKKNFLDYKLQVYFCKGDDKERLDWFKTINVYGEKVNEQEIRNAVYTCQWLTDAKRYFSRSNCPASDYSKYMNGSAIRQDYLKTAIEWIADSIGMTDSQDVIAKYMAEREAKEDKQAVGLWNYYQSVMNWVQSTFNFYDGSMKGVDWGILYNRHKDESLDSAALKEKVIKLLDDDAIGNNKKGIYAYVLDGNETHLDFRAFKKSDKEKKYREQNGVCPICKKSFDISQMEGDHIVPWRDGGRTEYKNLQMLCKLCNRTKSGK